MNLPLPLLLDSALRSAILGLLVWALLRLLRLRDARAEILIWTMVLLTALAMPLLRLEVPAGLAVPLPQLGLHPAATVTLPAAAPHGLPLLAGKSGVLAMVSGMALPRIDWVEMMWGLYALAVFFQLARLATGLILTARLYHRAHPVTEFWAQGRAIRASAAVTGPISFGRCILLPIGYPEWSQTKLDAVLAHEESHIGRGDFFIQLLASLYRTVFWFSPFAWWLQARLCALAEAASDEAAIQRMDDPATYAEILVEVSRSANSLPIQVAMAKGPDISWRVDRILGARRQQRLGRLAQFAAAAAILPAALAVAGAHAAMPPAAVNLPRYMPLAVNMAAIAQAAPDTVAAPAPRPTPMPAHRTARASARASDATYDPRALLNAPDVTVIPALLPLSDGHRRKSSENAAFILGGNVYVPGN